MTDKNIEMMKKIIEEKKRKSAEQKGSKRPEKRIGSTSKARGGGMKTGGVTDK